MNLCFYAVAPRADSTVLCHVLTHSDVAISLMSITHLLGSLTKAKVINEGLLATFREAMRFAPIEPPDYTHQT